MSSAKKKRKKVAVPARVIKYVKIPLHWFQEPLYHSMKTVVRPPTKLTRRKHVMSRTRWHGVM